MPRTVDEGFRDFLAYLTPTALESLAAKSHRASIQARLDADFGVRRFFRIGSFGNGTSISGFSDVDYLACLRNNSLTANSYYSLAKVRDSLAARFPATNVRVSCPAVTVPFGATRAETTEVVPADLVSASGTYPVYDIPDCAGDWMRASPDAHIAYVATQHERLQSRVKPLIRFVKAWKYFRSVPISSFYLELRVAKYAAGEQTILYEVDLSSFFRQLLAGELAAIQDPMGISGYIRPCKTEAQREEALSKLDTAATRARKAFEAASGSRIQEAFEWWRLLFGEGFPRYYY